LQSLNGNDAIVLAVTVCDRPMVNFEQVELTRSAGRLRGTVKLLYSGKLISDGASHVANPEIGKLYGRGNGDPDQWSPMQDCVASCFPICHDDRRAFREGRLFPQRAEKRLRLQSVTRIAATSVPKAWMFKACMFKA
jgi:hypothetical protein